MAFDLDGLIATAKQGVADTKPVEQEVLLGGKLVTVRVFAVDSTTWTGITDRCPPRAGVVRDRQFGYSLPAAVEAYRAVVLVDGDEVDDMMRTNEGGETVSRWPEVFAALSSPDRKNIELAVWGLNEYDHVQKMLAAGKASKGSAAKN